ncbi:macro domain-containing protein [Bradyrhizobium sp. LB11.1]|uniref:macro domain-containing protein n=1 Tax=Bradyrhizobium sp. LB11.1 TaxID=3156326 RepID=UPI0033913703
MRRCCSDNRDQLSHVVSKESLHGKIIERIFNGDSSKFRRDVDIALQGIPAKKTDRTIKPILQYPIGTTAIISNGPHRVFLVAMSRTDLTTAKASSTVPLLWDALKGALHSVRNFGNGAPISLPLIGNGRSSVNIEPQHLLRLIVLALVDFGRNAGLPNQINIIVPEACFDLLDIREIKRDWSKR